MSKIKADTHRISLLSARLNRQLNSLNIIQSQIRLTIARLDWQVASRQKVDNRLNQIAKSIEKQVRKLENYQRFTQIAANSYAITDNNLSKQSRNLIYEMNRVRAMSILPATAGIITLQTIRKKNWFKSVVEFWGKFKPILIADLCVLLLILEFFSKNTGGPANTETYTKPRDKNKDTQPNDTPGQSGEKHAYYYLSDERWGFPNGGHGFCVATAYAMLISYFQPGVTPKDVFDTGYVRADDGYIINHVKLVGSFGMDWIRVIEGPYNEKETPGLIKEMFEKYPQGIIVHFRTNKDATHSMLVTGYDESTGTFYYNDPNSAGRENMPPEKTWLYDNESGKFKIIKRISIWSVAPKNHKPDTR